MRTLACILISGCLFGQELSVAVTVNIIPSGGFASVVTRDMDGDGRIDRLELGFASAVDIMDPGGAADALPCLSLSGGYAIAPGDYAGTGVVSLVLPLVEGMVADTAATPTLTYNASGGSSITLQTDGTSSVAIDGARPVPSLGLAPPSVLRVPTVTVSWIFSEPVGPLVAGDLSLVNATLVTLVPSGADTWAATVAPLVPGPFRIGLADGAVQDAAGNPSRAPTIMTSTWFPPAADGAVRVTGAILAGVAPNGGTVRVGDTQVEVVQSAWSVAVPLHGDDPKRVTVPVRQLKPSGKRPIGEDVTIDISASDPGGGG